MPSTDTCQLARGYQCLAFHRHGCSLQKPGGPSARFLPDATHAALPQRTVTEDNHELAIST